MHKLVDLKPRGDWQRNAILVDEGDSPISRVVLPDHRAVLWKRYSNAAATAGTMRCASKPNVINDNVEGLLLDLCEGIIYAKDGERVQP